MSGNSQVFGKILDPEACRLVLGRVAASQVFKRAARLREFLLYIGEKSLNNDRTGLHEQEIGETVFARAKNYDTGQDNIVRVSATELRKRVNAYFAGPGKDEAIVFEVPRGAYAPVFRWREEVAAPEVESASNGEAASMPADAMPPVEETAGIIEAPALVLTPPNHAAMWIVSGLAVLLALACALLLWQNQVLERRIRSQQSRPGISFAMPAVPGVVPARS